MYNNSLQDIHEVVCKNCGTPETSDRRPMYTGYVCRHCSNMSLAQASLERAVIQQ